MSSSYDSLEGALESHDVHQERAWEQPGPSESADVVLVSDEYKPDSVGPGRCGAIAQVHSADGNAIGI